MQAYAHVYAEPHCTAEASAACDRQHLRPNAPPCLQLGLLVRSALEAVRGARQQLPPLLHLHRVLQVAELILVPDVACAVHPEDFSMRPTVLSVVNALRAAMLHIARMDDPAPPEGVTLSDDLAVIRCPTAPSREYLKHLLRKPHGASCLTLPLALRPAAGVVHGDGSDPEGDAAREKYVEQEAGPWYEALWQLENVLLGLRASNVHGGFRLTPSLATVPADEEASPDDTISEPGTGRWAQACWHLLGGMGGASKGDVAYVLMRVQGRFESS